MIEADSVVLDFWVDDKVTPTHMVEQSVQKSAIFLIEADKSDELLFRVRVYVDGNIVGSGFEKFYFKDQEKEASLEAIAIPPKLKYTVTILDTIELLNGYASLGIKNCTLVSSRKTNDYGNCKVSFPDSGSATIALTLKDLNGFEMTENVSISVLQGIPTVNLKCNRTLVGNLENVLFSASTSDSNGAAKGGHIILHEWDFDNDGTYDDSTNTDTNSFAYPDTSASHTYTVRVRVTDDDRNKVESSVVSVKVENREPTLGSIEFGGTGTPWTLVVNEPIWLLPPTLTDPENNQIDSLWWDLNDDGIFETRLSSTDSIPFKFDTIATKLFKVYTKDSFGKSDTVARALTSHAGFQDTRDGQWYGQVEIGDQTWMSENINVGTFTFQGYQQSNDKVIEKYCRGDIASFCSAFGGLYQWAEAMQFPSACNEGAISDISCNRTIGSQPQGICPTGWHIPTKSDWSELMMTVGDSATAGLRLRLNHNTSASTIAYLQWDSLPSDFNPFGFSAVFANVALFDASAVFWEASASVNYPEKSYARQINYYQKFFNYLVFPRAEGHSVRCVKDRP